MAGRNDVAKLAGVSGATVSRVFNNPEIVESVTRDKVLAAARALEYSPNFTARHFVKGRSGNIGVILPKIPGVHIFSVHYFSEILSGMGEALSEKGYGLLLMFHEMKPPGENDYSEYFREGRADAYAVMGAYTDEPSLADLNAKGHSFCLVNSYSEDRDINYVDADNRTGAYEAVRHLLGIGHERIAFLNGPSVYINSNDRKKGYLAAMADAGIEPPAGYMLEGNYGFRSGYNFAERLLALDPAPTAVFCANDRMAAGLQEGLKKAGAKVPDDISVMGFDDADIAQTAVPAITTVRIPFYRLGRTCAENLVRLVEGTEKHRFGIFLKTELVMRDSVKRINRDKKENRKK